MKKEIKKYILILSISIVQFYLYFYHLLVAIISRSECKMKSLIQLKGVGSQIIESCLSYFSTLEFDTVRLAIDKGNPQSEAFWSKNHFVKTGEVRSDGVYTYYPMELKLMNRPKENNHQNEQRAKEARKI